MRQFFPFLLEMRFGRLDLVARIGDDKDEWWGRDISIYERAAVTGGSLFLYLSVSFSLCASGFCSSSDKEITPPPPTLTIHTCSLCTGGSLQPTLPPGTDFINRDRT